MFTDMFALGSVGLSNDINPSREIEQGLLLSWSILDITLQLIWTVSEHHLHLKYTLLMYCICKEAQKRVIDRCWGMYLSWKELMSLMRPSTQLPSAWTNLLRTLDAHLPLNDRVHRDKACWYLSMCSVSFAYICLLSAVGLSLEKQSSVPGLEFP